MVAHQQAHHLLYILRTKTQQKHVVIIRQVQLGIQHQVKQVVLVVQTITEAKLVVNQAKTDTQQVHGQKVQKLAVLMQTYQKLVVKL